MLIINIEISVKELTRIFQDKISELQEESDFQCAPKRIKYAMDKKGESNVRLAIGNIPLDYDLWEGLRNPAVVGLYPAGLRDIWKFYSFKKRESVDEYGRQTIFQISPSFDFALKHYSRALIYFCNAAFFSSSH